MHEPGEAWIDQGLAISVERSNRMRNQISGGSFNLSALGGPKEGI